MALLTGEMIFPSFLQFEILNLPIPQVQSNSLHKPSPGEGKEGNGLGGGSEIPIPPSHSSWPLLLVLEEGSESSHAAQAGFQKSHLIAACLGLGFTGALSTQIKNQNNDIQTELEEHLGLGVHSHIPPQQTAPSRCAGGCPNQPCRG